MIPRLSWPGRWCGYHGANIAAECMSRFDNDEEVYQDGRRHQQRGTLSEGGQRTAAGMTEREEDAAEK